MQATFDPRIVPDPYAPMLAAEDTRGSFQRQRARRAAILATARRILADGPELVTHGVARAQTIVTRLTK